jgi:SAM-dependent methyltransferase
MAAHPVGAAMKALLQRVPGARSAYYQTRILASVAYERWWADGARMNDRSILRGEWRFDSPAEQDRYRRVLGAVSRLRGESSWGDALEIGCAQGLFTAELVRRCASVAAYDVSQVACQHVARRLPQVHVRRLDIQRDEIPGTFDVVFAMCVLVYVHGRDRLDAAAARLAGTVRPGGLLVFNDLRLYQPEFEDCWWARWLVEGGLRLLDFLDGRHGLHLVYREVASRDVIGIYEKRT